MLWSTVTCFSDLNISSPIILSCASLYNIIFKFVERKTLLHLCTSISVSPTWRRIYQTSFEGHRASSVFSPPDSLMWICPLGETLQLERTSLISMASGHWVGKLSPCPALSLWTSKICMRSKSYLVFLKSANIYTINSSLTLRWCSWEGRSCAFSLRVQFLDLLFQIG